LGRVGRIKAEENQLVSLSRVTTMPGSFTAFSAYSDNGSEAFIKSILPPLGLSSSERCDLEHFARLRLLRRPSQQKQHRDFH
jgi:hypothetical protein